jgi:hypothetical protein
MNSHYALMRLQQFYFGLSMSLQLCCTLLQPECVSREPM